MTPDTRHPLSPLRPASRASLALQSRLYAGGAPARRWVGCACAVALLVLAGCKTDKEAQGTGVSRGKDPLVHGPTRIPRTDLPIPDRATGTKGGPKLDPLTMPTGGKAGYSDDPERFKGTFIPGKASTPASLAGRLKDDEGLKIADTDGVKLTGGTGANGLEAPRDVEPLLTELEKYGVKREDRTLEREGNQWVFRASVPIGNGARRQYTGASDTAAESVKQVADQIAADRK